MKKAIAQKIQKVLSDVAVNSVGKSISYGVYERKISPELSETMTKKKSERNKYG
ncbi:MAG: hypothetical protein ACLT46_02155 [Hungatella sp.]